jgi:hypothetical protein
MTYQSLADAARRRGSITEARDVRHSDSLSSSCRHLRLSGLLYAHWRHHCV